MVVVTPAEAAHGGRIVYVVLAHRLPEQVTRLVTLLLTDPDSDVVLHYDGDPPHLTHARLTWLPRRDVEWGRASIPCLFLDAMAHALAQPGCCWIVFLSGQDYPLRPLRHVRSDLLASPYDVHADSQQVLAERPWPLWEPLTRYGYHFRFSPALPGRVRRRLWPLIRRGSEAVQRRAARSPEPQPWSALPPLVLRNVGAQLAFGLRRRDNPFVAESTLHAGDAWFSIRAGAARQVLASLERDPSYTRYMSTTLVPDEAFFQSLFALRLPELSIGPWRRYRVFRPGESHPAVWRVADLPELLGSEADFARKFDSSLDGEILDRLDELVSDRAT